MFKRILFLSFLTAVIFVSACGNSKKGNADIPGMSMYDLSPYGTTLTIYVPDTAKTKLEVSAQSSGSINVKSGKDFQISISPGDGDLALKKSDISSDDIKKSKRYLMDEPTTIIWEAQVSGLDPEFHLYTVIKAGKDSYIVEDIKDAENFSENAIKKMYEAAKSIKRKEAKNS